MKTRWTVTVKAERGHKFQTDSLQTAVRWALGLPGGQCAVITDAENTEVYVKVYGQGWHSGMRAAS